MFLLLTFLYQSRYRKLVNLDFTPPNFFYIKIDIEKIVTCDFSGGGDRNLDFTPNFFYINIDIGELVNLDFTRIRNLDFTPNFFYINIDIEKIVNFDFTPNFFYIDVDIEKVVTRDFTPDLEMSTLPLTFSISKTI